jgi:hypothetical protein
MLKKHDHHGAKPLSGPRLLSGEGEAQHYISSRALVVQTQAGGGQGHSHGLTLPDA